MGIGVPGLEMCQARNCVWCFFGRNVGALEVVHGVGTPHPSGNESSYALYRRPLSVLDTWHDDDEFLL